MRHLKVALTASCAALALIAILGVGTASATELWKSIDWWPDETQGVNVKIQASLQLGTSALLEEEGGKTIDTCTGSELDLLIEESGASASTFVHPSGTFQKHNFTGCSHATTVLSGGKWKIKSIGGANGSLISENTEVTTKSTVFGISCIYKSTGGSIGTFKGNELPGGTATFEINGLLSGSPGCTSARWTAVYSVTNIPGLYARQ